MKTYEIKMNRARWMSLLIAILCIAIIVTLCTPYFTYGKATSTYVPANGDEGMLYGKTWVLSGVEEGVDGYQRIDISKDGKNSTVYTTNILRVNQLAAQSAYDTAVTTYNDIAANVESCDVAAQKCNDMVEALKAAGKDATAAQKKLDEANKLLGVAQAQLANAKTAVDNSFAAVEKAFSVDSAFAWVGVDQVAEYKALFAAYPEEFKNAMANSVRVDAFKAWLKNEYAAEYAEFEKTVTKKTEDKFYAKKMEELSETKKAELYTSFMATQDAITDAEINDVGVKIIEVLKTEMSEAAYDEKIAGELKNMKAISAEAAALAASAQKAAETAAKDGSAKSTSDKAAKDITAIEKELSTNGVTAPAKEYTATKIDRIEKDARLEEMEQAQKGEEALMKTTSTVKYNKGKVTFTFANGDKKETTFSTNVAYDSEKTISVLGYVGFPYNAEEFSSELAYEIKDYYINNVVVLPIVIAVLAVIGLVLAIMKKDSFASGICPAAAGIIGIIGYLCSDFMKLGDKYTTHIIVYAVVLVVAALQIALCIKEKKAK